MPVLVSPAFDERPCEVAEGRGHNAPDDADRGTRSDRVGNGRRDEQRAHLERGLGASGEKYLGADRLRANRGKHEHPATEHSHSH